MQVLFSDEMQPHQHEALRAQIVGFVKEAGFDTSNPAIDISVNSNMNGVSLEVQSCNDKLKSELKSILKDAQFKVQ